MIIKVYVNICLFMLYTNKSINLISFFITIILFLILNFCFFGEAKNPIENISNLISDKLEVVNDQNLDETILEEQTLDLGNWYIEIPAINLKAPIAEGTDTNTLNTKVGHFEETDLLEGNIGLAAHNRGYEYNFFENLKKLKINDEIIYTYENYKKTYIIDKIEIIENTDWSYLENYDENKITLITCVENEPKYRRCVQATEL